MPDPIPNPWDPDQTDEYAISIGIYCLYFPYANQTNFVKGFKITDVTKDPNVTDQVEVGHQLASGRWKNFISLMTDPGTLTVKGNFEFERGTPKPQAITNSRVAGPAGTVMLGIAASESDSLDIFFMCGANIQEDGDIQGAFGERMTTSVKFKLSGEPKIGTVECATQVEKTLAV